MARKDINQLSLFLIEEDETPERKEILELIKDPDIADDIYVPYYREKMYLEARVPSELEALKVLRRKKEYIQLERAREQFGKQTDNQC